MNRRNLRFRVGATTAAVHTALWFAIMLWIRHFLRHRPGQARFFVLALALLQFVAPTWHVCALGGHVAAHGALHGHSTAPHETPNDSRKPLICVCTAHPKHDARADGPQLSAAPTPQNHATCLALLLQTLPAQVAAPPAILQFHVVESATFAARRQSAPALAAQHRFRGRAPPLTA